MVACACFVPAEPAPFETTEVLGGLAIGGGAAVGLTAIIVAACRLVTMSGAG